MNPEVAKALSASIRTVLKYAALALATVFFGFWIRWISFIQFGCMCIVLAFAVQLRLCYRSELRGRPWRYSVAMIQVAEVIATVLVTGVTFFILFSASN
jgi:hypothetical protein